MRRASLTRMAALACVCAVGAPVTIAAALATAAPATADTQASTTLAGSTAALTSHNPGVGAVPASRNMTIELWMSGNQQAAQRLIDAVSTPGSMPYRQYLSPGAYSARFGPSAAQVRAVRSYLSRAGFSKVRASVNDDYVSATAPVSTINRAFSVQMRRYQETGPGGAPAMIESNDRDLTVPASIGRDILSVTGLNSTQPRVIDATTGTSDSTKTVLGADRAGADASACSRYWAQKTKLLTPAFHGVTNAALAVCGYSAKQIRAAYGQTSANSGSGKTIALIEVGAPTKMFQTLSDYARANGLPAPHSDQYREEAIGQGGACGNPGDDEEQLDSEAAYAMAPGANQLMVDGDSCDTSNGGVQALLDAELAPLTGNGSSASVAIESASEEIGYENQVSASFRKVSHAIALRAAAEGVSLLFASGDDPGVRLQSSDPDVTAVGGTTLGVGARNQRVFETGWSDAVGRQTAAGGPWQDEGIPDGSGGGRSALYREPGYQRGVVPSALAHDNAGTARRTVPDISADADPASGMLFGSIQPRHGERTTPYTTFVGNGTSQSTPLVAGIVASAEQGQKNFGFLNPLLYSLAGSPAYHDILPVSSTDAQVDRAAYGEYTYYVYVKKGKYYLILTKPAIGVFDAQVPSFTDQVTSSGYDTMTGLGTPNGSAFIKGLRSGK